MTAKLELKNDIQPVFKKKKCAFRFFTTNKWRIRQTRKNRGLKTEYNQWASTTVYVKKKSKQIRVFADFMTGLKVKDSDRLSLFSQN